MRNDNKTRFIAKAVAAVGIGGWVLLAAAHSSGCGQSAVTPQLVRCQLDALKVLPEDPKQVTVADALDLVGRIRACRMPADAGTQ